MIVPRRLEEVVIAVPLKLYDRVVAALASEGIFHADEPPRGVPGTLERAYRTAYSQASEKLGRLRQYFAVAGVEPRTVKGVEINVSSSWIDSFRESVESFRDVEEFYEGLLESYNRLESKLRALEEARELLRPFANVEGDLASAYKSEVLDFVAGFTEESEVLDIIGKEVAKAGGVFAFEEAAGGGFVFAAAIPQGAGRRIASLASRLGAQVYTPPEDLPGSPSEALKAVEREVDETRREMEEVRRRAQSRLGELARYYTVVSAFAFVFRVLSLTLKTDTVAVVRGYVDVKDSRRLEEVVSRASLGSYVIVSLGVKRGEERVPSKVDLPSFLRPFHRIVEIYGHPEPDEIVPTIFLAVTMPLTFALMFPDAGHGLLVLLFALLYVSRISKDWAFVIGVLGASSIVSGLMAGEFFGPIASKIVGLPKLWEELGLEVPPYALPAYAVDHGLEELAPALAMRAINVSIIIGAFMLTFGTFLAIVNSLIKRDWEGLLARAIPRFLIFASVGAPFLVYLDASQGGAVIRKAVLEGGGGDPFATMVLLAFSLGVVWMLAAGPVLSAREGHGFLSGLGHSALEAYESLLMVVGNLPSFLRIMALAMAHSSLTLAVAKVSELILEAGGAGLVLAAALYVLGNLAIAGMEGLLSFAHATRLHFYEWFSKFYSGGGVPYSPLKLEGVVIRFA